MITSRFGTLEARFRPTMGFSETLSEENARRSVEALNRAFHRGELIAPAFSALLVAQGLKLAEVVLLSIIPYGGNTFFGRLIANGRGFAFDMSVHEPTFLKWEDVTDDFHKTLNAGPLRAQLEARAGWALYPAQSGRDG